MYDELIRRLRVNGELFQKYIPNAEGEILLQAADAIEELLAERDEVNSDSWKTAFEVERDEHRWIPVTERLPETPGEYMVAYHPCYWDRVHDEIKVGLDSFRGKTSWAKKKYQRVTHWMPLPPPPEEE